MVVVVVVVEVTNDARCVRCDVCVWLGMMRNGGALASGAGLP